MASAYLEELSSQIPAAQALALRGGLERNVLLEDVLKKWLQDNNQVAYKGEMHPFSDSAIQEPP